MLFITGDTHSDFRRFNMECFPEQAEMSKDNLDACIIAGDFGGIWAKDGERNSEKWWLDWLDKKNCYTLFVDGNHSNFDRLYQYPVKEWCDGLVHQIRPSVLHLMRGQVFDINGCKIFTFGGARSHDIQGGVLDIDDPEFSAKRKKADKAELPYRINHISWWAEEMPSEEEMQIGRDNLKKNGWKVDYIVTHDCAASTLALMSHGSYKPNELNKYLEEIRQKCKFKRHIFGHHHVSKAINDKDIALYEQIIRIW